MNQWEYMDFKNNYVVVISLKDAMSKEDYDAMIKQLVFERVALEDLEEKMERSFKRKPRSYKEG